MSTASLASLTAERDVAEAYSRMSEHLRQGGFRSTVFYMTAKHLADFDLIERINVSGKRILNIGCCEPLDELFWCRRDIFEWVATDINPDVVTVAEHIFRTEAPPEHQHKVRFEVADARALPYEDGSFDAVVSLHAIDHVPDAADRQKFVEEMARVTRPGGHVGLLSTNRYGSFLKQHKMLLRQPGGPPYGYAYFFTPRELRTMLRRAGLNPVYFTSEHKITDPYARGLKAALNRFLAYFGNRIGYLATKESFRQTAITRPERPCPTAPRSQDPRKPSRPPR
jgi:ubiquinone/menaquinone biosynthesis C-methylase UbiE